MFIWASNLPFKAGIFIDLGLEVLRGESVTQGSMGRGPPRYLFLMSGPIKRSNLQDDITCPWQ